MLGLAVLGGLILNLMPCVLPVLSLKLLSAVGHGGQAPQRVRLGFLASAAGIVALLTVCALLGFFVYAAAPVYQATIADYVEADSHGLSYGFTYLAMFGIGALGAAIAGTVLTYAGSGTLFVALAGLAGGAALLSGYLLVR